MTNACHPEQAAGRPVQLTFVIPVRHPLNARNWALGMRRLAQTAASIANQDHPGWRGIVVANAEAALPALPAQFSVVQVDFPPNPRHERGAAAGEAEFYQDFRLDKGRRVLAGLLHAAGSRYVMVVDDDDFVSRRLTSLAAGSSAPGWTLRRGFVWGDGGRLLYRHGDFATLCGTSHIVRTDLYALPDRMDAVDDERIKRIFGSHRSIAEDLALAGTPLAELPFPGAVYRIGHEGAHSQSARLLQTFIFSRRNLRRPVGLPRHVSRLRLLTPALRREFFGPADTAA